MTGEQLIAKYSLSPLPGEGGYFRRFYTHGQKLEKSDSHLASAIFYLITKSSFSAMHRLPSDDLYQCYLASRLLGLAIAFTSTRIHS
jgi:predicted cupin superfamily sugar epimerase